MSGRPGAGLVLLVCVVLGSAAFFAWGLWTPPLDRVWRIALELELGRPDPLSDAELRLIQDALCRHPEIASDLSMSVRPVGEARMGVVVSLLRGAKTQNVRARTVDASAEGKASGVEPFTWAPPGHRDCPTAIAVVIGDGKKKHRSTRVLLKELR